MNKEDKVKVLERIVEQKGECADIQCLECKLSFLDNYQEGSCDKILGVTGTTNSERYQCRLNLAKKRLAEIRGEAIYLDDEPQIILDQDK
jgi:hypothetical protein